MKQRLLSAVAATGIVAAALVSCAPTPPADSTDDVLRMGLAYDIAAVNFDPGIVSTWQNWTSQAVFDPLVQTREDSFDVDPALATDWSYNEDSTVLSMTLREGVTFSDGAPVDAEAVKVNLERTLIPGAAPIAAALLGNLTEVVVTGEYTFDIVVSRFNPELLFGLAGVGIASPASLEDPDIAQNPVGSGPYVLDRESSAATSLVFQKNEDHWDAHAYAFETIEMISLQDISARANALTSGQIDVALVDAATEASLASSDLETGVVTAWWQGLVLADHEGEVNPAIADVRVRQAISMAFDRQGIVDAVDQGLGTPTIQPFGLGEAAFHPELEDLYPYDPERAKELLAEAGYPDGFDLALPTYAGDNYDPVIIQALGDIGIRVKIEPLSDDWYPSVVAKEYSVFSWRLAVGRTIVDMVKPGGVFNFFGVDDPEVDRLLAGVEDGSATQEERDAAGSELGRYIIEQAWFAVIQHTATVVAWDPKLELDLQTVGGLEGVVLQNIRPAS